MLDGGLTQAVLAQLSTTKKSWLPLYLPEGVRVANKPGELGAVRNDVGIVFAPGRPFAIAVMTGYVRDERAAERAIGRVGLAAYRYFEHVGKSSEYPAASSPAGTAPIRANSRFCRSAPGRDQRSGRTKSLSRLRAAPTRAGSLRRGVPAADFRDGFLDQLAQDAPVHVVEPLRRTGTTCRWRTCPGGPSGPRQRSKPGTT